MEHFVLEHGGVLLSGIVAIMTIVIIITVIKMIMEKVLLIMNCYRELIYQKK